MGLCEREFLNDGSMTFILVDSKFFNCVIDFMIGSNLMDFKYDGNKFLNQVGGVP